MSAAGFTIDASLEGSRASAAKRRRETKALIEDVREQLEAGTTATEIARRRGKSPGSTSRRLYRAGEPELARPFELVVQRARRAAS